MTNAIIILYHTLEMFNIMSFRKCNSPNNRLVAMGNGFWFHAGGTRLQVCSSVCLNVTLFQLSEAAFSKDCRAPTYYNVKKRLIKLL